MSGRPRKYDPTAVEKEYVTGTKSMRQLSKEHGVAFSSLAAWAKRHDWHGKRIAYQSALSRRGYESMAADVASQEAEIRNESVTIMRATLRVYAAKLATGEVSIGVKDAVEAVRLLAVLLSEPEGVKVDPTIIDGRAVSKPDADVLRRVAEAARGRLASAGVLAGAADGEPSGTRPN